MAIYGGVEPNKDFNTSFAKFMYDNFGICAENAPSFEESIKHYERWVEGTRATGICEGNPRLYLAALAMCRFSRRRHGSP